MERNWGGGGAWLQVDQHKEEMDKEREDMFGVFTVEFAEGSWALYLIYFLNKYTASSCYWCSLEVLFWTLIMQNNCVCHRPLNECTLDLV